MKRALLISVAAVALAAGSTLALSQGGGQGAGPGASSGAPGGASAPMANPGGSQSAPGGSAREPQSTIHESPAPTAPGAKGSVQDRTAPPQQKSTQSGRDRQDQPGTQPRQQTQSPQHGGGSKQGAQQNQQPGGSKQGAAERPMNSKNVSLTVQQKTTIRNTVIASGPKITNVNFDISVGTVVPRTVRVAPVPVTLIEIEPSWRGYMYFVYADEIVVVEPQTLRIVAVLEV